MISNPLPPAVLYPNLQLYSDIIALARFHNSSSPTVKRVKLSVIAAREHGSSRWSASSSDAPWYSRLEVVHEHHSTLLQLEPPPRQGRSRGVVDQGQALTLNRPAHSIQVGHDRTCTALTCHLNCRLAGLGRLTRMRPAHVIVSRHLTSRSGGIGRRAGLRIPYRKV